MGAGPQGTFLPELAGRLLSTSDCSCRGCCVFSVALHAAAQQNASVVRALVVPELERCSTSRDPGLLLGPAFCNSEFCKRAETRGSGP